MEKFVDDIKFYSPRIFKGMQLRGSSPGMDMGFESEGLLWEDTKISRSGATGEAGGRAFRILAWKNSQEDPTELCEKWSGQWG